MKSSLIDRLLGKDSRARAEKKLADANKAEAVARELWLENETIKTENAYRKARETTALAKERLAAIDAAEQAEAQRKADEERRKKEAELAKLASQAANLKGMNEDYVAAIVKLYFDASDIITAIDNNLAIQNSASRDAAYLARELGVNTTIQLPAHRGNVVGLVQRAIRDELRRRNMAPIDAIENFLRPGA